MRTRYQGIMIFAAIVSTVSAAWAAESSAPPAHPAIIFIDSRVFDARLAKELDKGGKQVEVMIEGKMSINQIPPRLDKWLAQVSENGTVELRVQENLGRNRSLFSLVDMVFSAIQGFQESLMLRSANSYNAVIYYRREASGDALVDHVEFNKRL